MTVFRSGLRAAFLWGLLALPLSACATVDAPPRRVADAEFVAYRTLDGPQIRAAISGNTVVFTRVGRGSYPFFHTPEGERVASLPPGTYRGPWEVKGDLYCGRSILEDEERCNIVMERDGAYLFCREGGACMTRAVIEPGDPYSLN